MRLFFMYTNWVVTNAMAETPRRPKQANRINAAVWFDLARPEMIKKFPMWLRQEIFELSLNKRKEISHTGG